MKTDLYTKTILTIIAVCLLLVVVKEIPLIPTVQAENDPQEVQRYGLVPVNADGSITVKLSPMEEIDVNIRGVDTSEELKVEITGVNTYDELPVNIDEVGGSSVSSGGPIAVKIK